MLQPEKIWKGEHYEKTARIRTLFYRRGMAAVGDLRGGHRIGVLPDDGMLPVGESVFGVELQLVVTAALEQIDDFAQGFHRRDAVPAYVQHICAVFKHKRSPPEPRP